MKKIILPLIGQSILIWMLTSMIGSGMVTVIDSKGFYYEEILAASLVFSSPVNLLLVPLLYVLPDIEIRQKRLLFAVVAIIAFSVLIVILFFGLIGLPWGERSDLLPLFLPYILAAEVSFFLIARYQLITGKDITSLRQVMLDPTSTKR